MSLFLSKLFLPCKTLWFPSVSTDAPLMELIKVLPPAAIDAEFHSLAPESGGSLEWLAQLLRFLLEMLKTNQDFELVQSYIGLFLKVSTLPGGGGARGRLQDTFMHG